MNLPAKLLSDPSILAAYRERKVTAKDIAEQFGYRESYVLTVLSRLGVRRPQAPNSTYQQQKQANLLAETRKEFREFLAGKVRVGTYTLQRAAEIAGCSERTMRRYVDKQR